MLKLVKITQLAIQGTKYSRRVVNRVATNQINLSKASEALKDVYECSKNKSDYSKNILKRAWAWTKEFVQNFKDLKNRLAKNIEETKAKLGEKFTKKEAKETRKNFFANIKQTINDIKEEIKSLTKKPTEGNKKTKTSGTPKSEAKPKAPKNQKPDAPAETVAEAPVKKTSKKAKAEAAEAPATTETPAKAEAPVATVEAQTTNATPSFAGRNIKRIPLAELKEIAKAQGASEEMLNGVRTKAELIKIIETLKAGS